jgi:hypothetical protein
MAAYDQRSKSLAIPVMEWLLFLLKVILASEVVSKPP